MIVLSIFEDHKYYCAGCEAEIDIDCAHHIWEDEDDEGNDVEVFYHCDCCPGKHVSQGDCQDVFTNEEYE